MATVGREPRWPIDADAFLSVAADLHRLVAISVQAQLCALQGQSPPEDWGQASSRLLRARAKGELREEAEGGSSTTDLPSTDIGDQLVRELNVLVGTISALAHAYEVAAQRCAEAVGPKRGRPKKFSSNRLEAAIFNLQFRPPLAPKERGRKPPSGIVVSDDEILRLAAKVKSLQFRSERELFESYARSRLQRVGKHTAGRAPAVLTKYLQRRLAELRAIRKSPANSGE